MNQDRVAIEDLCMQDTKGYICSSKDIDSYESLCAKQLPTENYDDWSESRHY